MFLGLKSSPSFLSGWIGFIRSAMNVHDYGEAERAIDKGMLFFLSYFCTMTDI